MFKTLLVRLLARLRNEPSPYDHLTTPAIQARFASKLAELQDGYCVQLWQGDSWRTVAAPFPTFEAAIDHAKEKFSGAWEVGKVRAHQIGIGD